MTDYQLDTRPFFQILHNLIRHDHLDYDPEALAQSVEWVRAHAIAMRTVTSSAEFGIIRSFYAYWDKHKIAPDRKVLGELVHSQQKCEPMLQVLAEYDKHAEDLEVISHLSLDLSLDQRIEDYEKYKLTNVLTVAASITIGPRQMNDKEKTTLCGPRDAMKFLHERFQQGILFNQVPVVGGPLSETVGDIKHRYSRVESENRSNNLFIRSGIPAIDNHFGGLRRKELNGILGFTGQRKTVVARTIGYNAAQSGFRVLHIPLESDYEEEETSYAVMHARAMLNQKDGGISKKRVETGTLSNEDRDTFLGEVIPAFQADIARNIIVRTLGASRAWADVRDLIERENDKETVDLVIIDYLTMLATPGNRDDMADKMAIIQDAKRLCLTANDNRGLCILTPVQGNRDGYEKAANNDGVWSASGIAKYSEMEKSLDNCFYTFFNDEMNAQNQMKIGSCKSRRDHNLPATLVSVDGASGMVLPDETLDVMPGLKEPEKPRFISNTLSSLEGIEEALA